MAKSSKNEGEILNLIVKLQEQISLIDKKVDTLMGRIMSTPALMANAPKLKEQPPVRQQYQITCADCGKEA